MKIIDLELRPNVETIPPLPGTTTPIVIVQPDSAIAHVGLFELNYIGAATTYHHAETMAAIEQKIANENGVDVIIADGNVIVGRVIRVIWKPTNPGTEPYQAGVIEAKVLLSGNHHDDYDGFLLSLEDYGVFTDADFEADDRHPNAMRLTQLHRFVLNRH